MNFLNKKRQKKNYIKKVKNKEIKNMNYNIFSVSKITLNERGYLDIFYLRVGIRFKQKYQILL